MDKIKLWIPLDTNVKAESYQIPTIENQRATLFSIVGALEEEPEEEPPQNNGNFFSSYSKKRTNPLEKKLESFSQSWVDIMSYSHNVSNDQSDAYDKKSLRTGKVSTDHIGELTLTKFACDRTPSLNYMTIRGEVFPHVILRVYLKPTDENKHILPIFEYEMHHVTFTNVSISGGAGGKPVESFSLKPKIFSLKNVSINLTNGVFETYQVFNWDTLKNSGSKTIYSNEYSIDNGSKSLFELAKKHLMVDLDSRDPQTIALIKELGIITEYELPSASKNEEPFDDSEMYKVVTNKEPILYTYVDIDKSNLTLDTIKKAISEQINIPLEKIKNLYNYDKSVLLTGNQRILNITKTFLVQTTDNKFYYGE